MKTSHTPESWPSLRISLSCLLAFGLEAHAADLANVRAQQRPKTKLVDVYYDLVADEGEIFDVSVSFSAPGISPKAETLEGDVGKGILPGCNKHIVWDAGTDWPDNSSDDFSVEITAETSGVLNVEMVRIPGGTSSGTGDGWRLSQLSVPFLELQTPTEENTESFKAENNYVLSGVRSQLLTLWNGDNGGPFQSQYQYSHTTEGFWMDATEVTYAHYAKVLSWGIKNGYEFEYSGYGKGGNHPVCNVSPFDILKWCNARSEMEGRMPVYMVNGSVWRKGKAYPELNVEADGYRVPTFDEWHFAARGGSSGLIFPTGDTIDHLLANFYASDGYSDKNKYEIGRYRFSGISSTASRWGRGSVVIGLNYVSYDVYYRSGGRGSTTAAPIVFAVYLIEGDGYCPLGDDGALPYTTPVAAFPANPYGLHDMAGNVSEFVYDGGTTGGFLGGSWSSPGRQCSFYENRQCGSFSDTASTSMGFRCIRK